MMFLLFFFVASIGSAVAASDDMAWAEELLQAILANNKTTNNVIASTPELIADNNYTVEVHDVTTEDGYILEVHRIPASPTSPAAEDKPVAFLMHGLLSSSADWIVSGPEKALGYILADAGYDVWMGNARGNTYSKNHTNADISSEEFWDFSWHEIGYYDLPAMIDYILTATGQEQVYYIGHSQGTTSFYVMASTREEYNAKIDKMFSLAPVSFMSNLPNLVLRGVALGNQLVEVPAELLGIYEIFPNSPYTNGLAPDICPDGALTQELCADFVYFLSGYNPDQLNKSMLPIFLSHFPAGSSIYQVIHYGQLVQSAKFSWYDYGVLGNTAKYSSLSPPEYDLSSITASVYLIYGANDVLTSPTDVIQLSTKLGNLAEIYEVPDKLWGHFDFLWAINASQLVYDHVLEAMSDL